MPGSSACWRADVLFASAAPMNTARRPSWPRWRPGRPWSPNTAPASMRRRPRSTACRSSTISAARRRRRTMPLPGTCSCASRRRGSSRNACCNRSGRTPGPPLPAAAAHCSHTCPHCGDRAARGDQCDSCGRLLDPVGAGCPLLGALGFSAALETRETRHLICSCCNRSSPTGCASGLRAGTPVAGTRSPGPGAAGTAASRAT